MNTWSICVLLACLALSVLAQGDDQPKSAQRGNLLKRGPLTKGKQTTTTSTTPAPQQEYDDYEYEDGQAETANSEPTEPPPVSSTEGKKLVGSGVRPFRSNTDLLEALKRRRAEAAQAKHSAPAQPAAATPQESSPATQMPSAKATVNGKKRYSSAPARSEAAKEDAAPIASKPSRNRFSRPSARSYQDPESEEQINEATHTRTARTFRGRAGN